MIVLVCSRSATARITTFEARERLWISEKMTMEQRVKELMANEKRLQDELRQAKANSAGVLHHSVPENLNCEGVEVEHLVRFMFDLLTALFKDFYVFCIFVF